MGQITKTQRRVSSLLMLVALVCAVFTVQATEPQKAGKIKPISPKDNKYIELRAAAFKTTANDAGIANASKKLLVYGVIMDWNLGGEVMTSVSLISGDSRLYLSSGGALLNQGNQQIVKDAVRELMTGASEYVSVMKISDDTTQPKPDGIKFYLLTNHGRYVVETTTQIIDAGTSPLGFLFSDVQFVISELRRASRKS